MWAQSLGWEDPLEEDMVTHSSILAWKIPWTEEPGGLQSMSHKVSDTAEQLTLTVKTETSQIKNLPANAGGITQRGFDPYVGKIPGGGHGNPLQYSCLENPMDRAACQATVHGVAKSWI